MTSQGVRRQSSGLLAAFQEDHAALGKGFHELSVCLRGDDVVGARRVAGFLDKAAGAHIAFEEADFYPRLEDLIGEDDVRKMYADHADALDMIELLAKLAHDRPLPEEERRRLVAQSEAMEGHIAECGALFEAMGRIPEDEQDALCRRLLEWRRKAPTWRGYAAEGPSRRRPRSE